MRVQFAVSSLLRCALCGALIDGVYYRCTEWRTGDIDLHTNQPVCPPCCVEHDLPADVDPARIVDRDRDKLDNLARLGEWDAGLVWLDGEWWSVWSYSNSTPGDPDSEQTAILRPYTPGVACECGHGHTHHDGQWGWCSGDEECDCVEFVQPAAAKLAQ